MRSDYEWMKVCADWHAVKMAGEVKLAEFARARGCHRATLSGKYRAYLKEREC